MVLRVGQKHIFPHAQRGQTVGEGHIPGQGEDPGGALHTEALHKNGFRALHRRVSQRREVMDAREAPGGAVHREAVLLHLEGQPDPAPGEDIGDLRFGRLDPQGPQPPAVHGRVAGPQEDRTAEYIERAILMNDVSPGGADGVL